jgi:hypothetical protein
MSLRCADYFICTEGSQGPQGKKWKACLTSRAVSARVVFRASKNGTAEPLGSLRMTPRGLLSIREVVDKYLNCGDLHCGFARVRCPSCANEYLLAFSCKGRYFCPACHQKRVLQFAEWVTQEVLEPVPHSQYVFTIPKMLRVYFKHDRKLLGALSQCAWETLLQYFQAAFPDSAVRPGAIVSIQTYGRACNYHPHLHLLVSDG